MKDFLRGIGVFISKNKGVALVVTGVIAIVVIAGVVSFGKTNSINPMYALQGVTSPSAGTTMYRGNAVSDSSTASYEKGISPMPPIYNGTPASTPDLPSDRKVIQNGSLDILVKNADDTAKKITTIAESNDGFTESSNLYEVSDGVKSGSVTVRVPTKNFGAVMEAIKVLATKVKNEGVNSSDVTAQYVDLEAQIKNYRAEEAQYRDIMARAVKIQDVLDVASRLADVRGQIERTQGQLNYLSRQVAMSTIVVSMTAEPEVQVFGIVWRPLTVLKQAFKSLLTDLTGFVDWLIRFVFALPIIILRIVVAALIVWILWIIIVWFKRKFWSNRSI